MPSPVATLWLVTSESGHGREKLPRRNRTRLKKETCATALPRRPGPGSCRTGGAENRRATHTHMCAAKRQRLERVARPRSQRRWRATERRVQNESSDDDDGAFSGVPRRSVGTLADGAWSGRAGVGHLTDGSLSDDSCESEASSDSEEAHRQSETLPAADAGASSCLPSAARAAAIADLASQVGTPRPPAALPTAAPQHVNKATQLAPCRLRGHQACHTDRRPSAEPQRSRPCVALRRAPTPPSRRRKKNVCPRSETSPETSSLRGVDPELNRGCAPSPPARLQRVDKSCHQQSRRI